MSATLKNGAGILNVLAEMTLEEKATLVTMPHGHAIVSSRM